MDPPAFGRGPKGEVWKIEESIHELMALIPSLMSPDARLIIVNGYASGYSARTFAELLQDALLQKNGEIIYGDVGIVQKGNDRLLTTGIYAKWRA
jgi:23S rRNA (cytosine1962-C5)-methyltransferase